MIIIKELAEDQLLLMLCIRACGHAEVWFNIIKILVDYLYTDSINMKTISCWLLFGRLSWFWRWVVASLSTKFELSAPRTSFPRILQFRTCERLIMQIYAQKRALVYYLGVIHKRRTLGWARAPPQCQRPCQPLLLRSLVQYIQWWKEY